MLEWDERAYDQESGEYSWHGSGADVSDRWIGGAITAVGILLLMVLGVVLLAQPGNQQPAPGGTATPTTYGPPRG